MTMAYVILLVIGAASMIFMRTGKLPENFSSPSMPPVCHLNSACCGAWTRDQAIAQWDKPRERWSGGWSEAKNRFVYLKSASNSGPSNKFLSWGNFF